MPEYTHPDLSGITIDSFVDVIIRSHGFAAENKVYFFHVETLWNAPLAGQYLVLFRHCYDFTYKISTGEIKESPPWTDVLADFKKYTQSGRSRDYVWENDLATAYHAFLSSMILKKRLIGQER